MVPHDPRYRYKVKQTEIMLAPNQPPPPITHDTLSLPEETVHWSNHPHTENYYMEEESLNQNIDDEDDEDDIIWFEHTTGDTRPVQDILHDDNHNTSEENTNNRDSTEENDDDSYEANEEDESNENDDNNKSEEDNSDEASNGDKVIDDEQTNQLQQAPATSDTSVNMSVEQPDQDQLNITGGHQDGHLQEHHDPEPPPVGPRFPTK